MRTAENLAATNPQPPSWAEICESHPDEWVLLDKIEQEDDRTVRSARVLDHGHSVLDMMDRTDPMPEATLMQTAGRSLWMFARPRLILDPDDEVDGLAPGASFTVARSKR